MYRVERTVEFETWLDGLRDRTAQKRIVMRIRRAETGLLGDWKTLSDGVSEMRVDYGPGYRLYYTIREQVIIILLCGSEKRDQDRAIRLAKELVKTV
jgi:putative addiction module killer protein